MKHIKSIAKMLCVLFLAITCFLSAFPVYAAGSTQTEAARKERVYVGNYKEIWAVNMKTGNAQPLKQSNSGNNGSFKNLERVKNFIYYDGGDVKKSTAGIYRFDLDKNKEYKLADGKSPMIYKNKIYYLSYKKSGGKKVLTGISSMNLNGSNNKLVIPKSDTNLLFTVCSGKVFYIGKNNKTLSQANLQGGSKKEISALDTSKAIYMTSDRDSVYIKCNYTSDRKRYFQYNVSNNKVKLIANENATYKIIKFDGNYFYDYNASALWLNDFSKVENDPVALVYAGDTGRSFESVATFNSKYVVCETSFFQDGYKHTLSILDRNNNTYKDIIPDVGY